MHIQLLVYIAFLWAKRAPFEIRCFCHKNILKLFCIIFVVKKCNLQFWLFLLQTYIVLAEIVYETQYAMPHLFNIATLLYVQQSENANE